MNVDASFSYKVTIQFKINHLRGKGRKTKIGKPSLYYLRAFEVLPICGMGRVCMRAEESNRLPKGA
jgi:hypothetical protein